MNSQRMGASLMTKENSGVEGNVLRARTFGRDISNKMNNIVIQAGKVEKPKTMQSLGKMSTRQGNVGMNSQNIVYQVGKKHLD